MSIDTAELRRLAEAATPGPWKSTTLDYVWRDEILIASRDEDRNFSEAAKDIAYIAAANPQAILALLDELDALRHGLERAIAENARLHRIGKAVSEIVATFYQPVSPTKDRPAQPNAADKKLKDGK